MMFDEHENIQWVQWNNARPYIFDIKKEYTETHTQNTLYIYDSPQENGIPPNE